MAINSVIKKEANHFADRLVQVSSILSLGKDELNTKLYNFSTDKSKFEFLGLVREDIFGRREKHIAFCQTKNCQTEEGLNKALFILDEEIESMNTYYIPRYTSPDEFTPDEKSNINLRLDEVVKLLQAGGMAHEIIAEEIDELRENLNVLGKKSWFEQLKGKLFDISINYVLSPDVITQTFKTIARDFGFTFKFLN